MRHRIVRGLSLSPVVLAASVILSGRSLSTEARLAVGQDQRIVPERPAGDVAPVNVAPPSAPRVELASDATAAMVSLVSEVHRPVAERRQTVAQPPTGPLRLRPNTFEEVRELAGADPSRADELERTGWEAYQRGDVETALIALSEAAARPDAKAWVLYVVGLSQMALDRPRDAATAWERVRRAAPRFSPVYRDLAAAYVRTADLKCALEVLVEAQRRWPSNAEFHNAIGVLHTGRGAVDAAIEAFVKAAKAAPDDPVVHLNLGLAYEMRLEQSRRSITIERQSAARWAAEEADRRKAEESFQRCIDLGGPYAERAADALSRVRGTGKPKR